MRRSGDKHFHAFFYLSPGEYYYKFVVDDNVPWFFDVQRPNCDDGQGNKNNVINVGFMGIKQTGKRGRINEARTEDEVNKLRQSLQSINLEKKKLRN